jgi:hypothetical protein
MIDVILLAGKLVLIALLYLFLLSAVRAGIRLVRAGAPVSAVAGGLALVVASGPKELRGVRVPLDSALVIGRSAEDADLVIAGSFISARHARISPSAAGPVIEDLGSTNGSVVNGQRLEGPRRLETGDTVTLGDVRLEVERL